SAPTYGLANFSRYSRVFSSLKAAASTACSSSRRYRMFTAPSGPITAIPAVGYAKFASPRMCLEDMTQYAPPYALRVMTVSFGTVASQYANSSFAPCLMIPPYSCAVPGRNPGTSSKVTRGTLKQSQNRTNRAPLSDALMSRQPARWAGWLATMPDVPECVPAPPSSSAETSSCVTALMTSGPVTNM